MAVSKKQILQALRDSGGFKTHAAKQLGMTYQGLWKRIKKDKDLADACEEIRESYLDLAESQLVAAVRDREPWAICFLLKCLGKRRGYVERQQLEHSTPDGSMLAPTRIEIVAPKSDDNDTATLLTE